MELHVDDDAYVRAPKGLVYRRLTDLRAWPEFWPACQVSTSDDGNQHGVAIRPTTLALPVRFEATAHSWRHDEGFALTLRGDVRGEAEFWLEEGWGGTVVHHLASLTVEGRRGRSVGSAYRASLRLGFGGLKDDLQRQVRTRLGMTA